MKKKARRWVLLGILVALFATTAFVTACSDSNSPLSGQSMVTVRGASQ